MGKKRKLNNSNGSGAVVEDEVDTTKPSAVFVPKGGRTWTLSVALPGSVITNAVSHDQKNNLAGTIARALAVFSVDEIVIFDDGSEKDGSSQKGRNGGGYQYHQNDPSSSSMDSAYASYTGYSEPSHFLMHLLSYLETPPYLRRTLFPMHPDLKTAGSLPSLDMPHHSKNLAGCPYREGVTLEPSNSHLHRQNHHSSSSSGTYVDVGLGSPTFLPDVSIPANTRVTVKYASASPSATEIDYQTGTAVSPSAPREEAGYYWGYGARRAASLSAVFTECPYDGGYDLSFGTSERGDPVAVVLPRAREEEEEEAGGRPTPPPPAAAAAARFSHMLLVFGGPAGLEVAAKADKDLAAKGVGAANVRDLFDYWVNVLPDQGSRTIRTEEAVWLGLMGLRGVVEGNR